MKTFKECLKECCNPQEPVQFAHFWDGPYYAATVKDILNVIEKFPVVMNMDAKLISKDVSGGLFDTYILDEQLSATIKTTVVWPRQYGKDVRVQIVGLVAELIEADNLGWFGL